MHPAIGELVSRVFYSSRVRTGPAAPRRGTGMTVLPSPVTWVDTRSLRGNVESRAGGTSLFNLAEARLVTSITRYVAAQAPPNLSIGIITAYAEQRDLLRRLMGPRDEWPADRQLEIDTVDAFEGREKDIIILSLVRANRRRDIGFLRLEQRLNVAVSRARRLLIVVGDTSTLRGGYFHNLIATAGSVGSIVPAPRLLGQLLHRTRKPRPERVEVVAVDTPDGIVVEAAAIAEPGEPAGVNGAAEGGFDFRSAPSSDAGGEQAAPPTGSRRRRRRRALERLRERRAAAEAAPASGASDEDGIVSPATEGAVSGQAPQPAAQAEPSPSTQDAPDTLARRPRARRRLARLALTASRAATGASTAAGASGAAPADTEPAGRLPATADPDASLERRPTASVERPEAAEERPIEGVERAAEAQGAGEVAERPAVRRRRRATTSGDMADDLSTPSADAAGLPQGLTAPASDAAEALRAEGASAQPVGADEPRTRRGRRRVAPSAPLSAEAPTVAAPPEAVIVDVEEQPQPRRGRRRVVPATDDREPESTATREPVVPDVLVESVEPQPRRGRRRATSAEAANAVGGAAESPSPERDLTALPVEADVAGGCSAAPHAARDDGGCDRR